MFPAGAPGIALLILRVSLAAAILDGGPGCLKPAVGPLLGVALAAQGLLLCVGFMTPVVAIIACALELLSLLVAAHADIRFIALTGRMPLPLRYSDRARTPWMHGCLEDA